MQSLTSSNSFTQTFILTLVKEYGLSGVLFVKRLVSFMHQSMHKNQEMRYHGQPQHTPPCGHQCAEHYQCPSWISANLEILSRVNLNEHYQTLSS